MLRWFRKFKQNFGVVVQMTLFNFTNSKYADARSYVALFWRLYHCIIYNIKLYKLICLPISSSIPSFNSLLLRAILLKYLLHWLLIIFHILISVKKEEEKVKYFIQYILLQKLFQKPKLRTQPFHMSPWEYWVTAPSD